MLNSNPTGGGAHTTSIEVWSEICSRGGLQPNGWDADLLADIAARLGASDALTNATFKRWLQGPDAPSVEQLVAAVLGAIAPFGGMMSDLLRLVADNGGNASGNDDALVMAFDFDDPDAKSVEIDLGAFKRAQEVVGGLTAARPLALDHFLTVFWALNDAYPGDEIRDLEQELGGFYRAADPPPTVPRSNASDPDLAREIDRFWLVWERVRAYAQDRWDERSASGPSDPDDFIWTFLANRNSADEQWLVGAARAAHRVTRLTEDAQRELAPRLAEALDGVEASIEPVAVDVAQLMEVLDLPVFEKRHDLYSAWLLTQIITAWPGTYALHLVEDGALRFPFRPTHFATLQGGDEDLYVVGELKTPLASGWKSTKRKDDIQPDYSIAKAGADDTGAVLADPKGVAADSIIVDVEAKQYKTPGYPNFAAALADYAVSHASSAVFLVNHRGLNSATLQGHLDKMKSLPADARQRMHPFAYVCPYGAGQRPFLDALRAELPPLPVSQRAVDAHCEACTQTEIDRWLNSAPTGCELLAEDVDEDGHRTLRVRLAPLPCQVM